MLRQPLYWKPQKCAEEHLAHPSAGDNYRLKVTHDGASIGPHCLQFR